jgi:aspartate/methionine/tyrosine aminotransferase
VTTAQPLRRLAPGRDRLHRPRRGKEAKPEGKDVVELEIGDGPVDTTASARKAAKEAVEAGYSR